MKQRTFTSYGPVEPGENFYVPREALVNRCVAQLVGNPDKGGHYFTIWAPRQTGKTWLMRRAIEDVRQQFGNRFIVGTISMQSLVDLQFHDPEYFLQKVPLLFRQGMQLSVPVPTDFSEFGEIFSVGGSYFDRPVMLLIDEFDKLPAEVIDRLIGVFRGIYLSRTSYWLHSLALVGVRAVLGVDSPRGSPFNIQRSLQVPNLTVEEVRELFDQYQKESGQTVDSEVVEQVYASTLGQPGLVGWFGELLTEKYNPGAPKAITLETWARVHRKATNVEPNNTILNLISKARTDYVARVVEIFTRTDVPFHLDEPWCNHLYMNGIISSYEGINLRGEVQDFCRFTCPFIQQRLYHALISTTIRDGLGGPALELLDLLEDVFTDDGLRIPPLLDRYRSFLQRIRAAGILPWRDQPRRTTDEQPLEAIGHFHLYAWLLRAIGSQATITPEFPTGNGTVDLVIRWQAYKAVIEVKSFIDRRQLKQGREQAARYARQLGLKECTLAVFTPTQDETILEALSSVLEEGDVTVATVAIGWGGV